MPLTRKQILDIHQMIGVTLWYTCESLSIPPGNKRLQLYHLMKENPPRAMSLLAAKLDHLNKTMPLNLLTVNIGINGIQSIAEMIFEHIEKYLDHMEGIIWLQLLPVWAGLGFPVVELDHQLLSRAMATELSADEIDQTKLPFDAFSIRFPSDVYKTRDETGTSRTLDYMLVGHLPGTIGDMGPPPVPIDAYAYIAPTSRHALWSAFPKLSEMVLPQSDKEEQEARNLGGLPLDDLDHKIRRDLVYMIAHASRIAASKGGLEIPGDDVLVPSFRENVMPEFALRIFKLGLSDMKEIANV